jgi:hypothetical protein
MCTVPRVVVIPGIWGDMDFRFPEHQLDTLIRFWPAKMLQIDMHGLCTPK